MEPPNQHNTHKKKLDICVDAKLNRVDDLTPSIKNCRCFKHYAWHGHPLILSMLTIFHFPMQLPPNLLHLMSMFSIP